ncbi:MAG: RES family NAD+ phosphorylase [Nitrospirae bacterium]|nr:RES family NAD+ phosphorylase [Nitrospirota bacterium]
MKCCGSCFGDAFLSGEIEQRAKVSGHCDYCGGVDVKLVDPAVLIDFLEKPLGVYKESTDSAAHGIEALLRKDWALFEKLEPHQAELLLSNIFQDDNFIKKKYMPVKETDFSAIQEWDDFREELKHHNRFFPKKFQPTKELKELFGFLTARSEDIPAKVYRARICEHPDPYSLDQMGKPPARFSGNGRANPVGIPCLYVASDADTAITEIRPHKGELVCVAEFAINERIQLADLRNPRKSISPFLLDDLQIELLFKYMDYLCRLGEELTMPILPKVAHLEYLPSQYICEFIKDCAFDGVIYASALGPGVNYAIFDDSGVAGTVVHQYRIDAISIGFSALNE